MKRILRTIALVGGMAAGWHSPAAAQPITAGQAAQFQKINQVMYLVSKAYVDTVDLPRLVEKAIVEMLGNLDPHSVYVGAEELKIENQEIEGNFEGIGIEFNVLRDTIVVVNTVPGGPSERVGLLSGDRIVGVDGRQKTPVRLNDVPKFLRGPKGTRVELRVVRPGVADTLDFSIVRDKIPMHSLDAAYRIDKQTGYIKLNRFIATTDDELRHALNEDLRGISALILDLRGNGGGLLDQSIRVAGNFLQPGSLVVYTAGQNMLRQEARTAPEPPLFGTGRLVVLVDESSASASEIIAGAMQDWDRATIVGRRTFGKGLVQQQMPLNDGSAVRLTVAHYYTPSGRSIQRPYKQGDVKGYYRDLNRRYDSGELTGGPAAVDSSQTYRTLVRGREVYGGGGIQPDIFVPIDTTAYSEYWSRMVRKGVLLEFVVSELDGHRAEYRKKYPDFETFARDFSLTPEQVERLVSLGKARGVPADAAGLERSRRLIATQIKALIAQRLWNTTAYCRVVNAEMDPEFAAAVEAVRAAESR